MCGIAGIASADGIIRRQELLSMASSLKHRGPDDGGIWIADSETVGFAHRRLSVIDTSSAGHQPMRSASGRFVITFNGEIYNFQSLRRRLESLGQPPNWRGHSDTEVLLAGFDCWGVHETLRLVDGMFAFAAWDESTHRLYLSRDRIGEKPLYVGCFGKRLVFASELRALRVVEGHRTELDSQAVDSFLRFGYVSGAQSILKGVFRFPPGHLLELPRTSIGMSSAEMLRCAEPYWSLEQVAQVGQSEPSRLSSAGAADTLEALLRDSIGKRMIADVPLGAFLSGGIDSSTVVALMQSQSSRPVKTFSIGFEENKYNEAQHAKAVALHLKTDHTEFFLTARDAIDLIPSICDAYDEPFADASQIPTLLLARMARRQVTVALSGDGGDELFGGYQRYFSALAIRAYAKWMPYNLRRQTAQALRLTSLPTVFGKPPGSLQLFRVQRFATRLAAADIDLMRMAFLDHSPPLGPLPDYFTDANPQFIHKSMPGNIQDPLRRQMFADQMSYLPNDILVKVDRATMSSGLEARVPLLDHRIVEFSWSLPTELLTRNGKRKAPLRDVLARYVPLSLFDRPKMGFDMPLAEWLRDPLREWAGQMLTEAPALIPMIDTQHINHIWREHCLGNIDACHYLWNVLMLTSWARRSLEDN